MDRAECNEEKGLDWRGSADECRFNFAFHSSAWIKTRARLVEQQILSCDVGKIARNFIAHEEEQQNTASRLLRVFFSSVLSFRDIYTYFFSLSLSRLFSHHSSFTELFTGFEKDGTRSPSRSASEKCAPLAGEARSLIPDYGGISFSLLL